MHRRLGRVVIAALCLTILFCVALAAPARAEGEVTDEVVLGTIVEVLEDGWRGAPGVSQRYQVIELALRTGSQSGQRVRVEQDVDQAGRQVPFRAGQEVWVSVAPDAEGRATHYILGISRVGALLGLFAGFAGLVLVVGRGRGARALLGLLVSFVVVFALIVPRVMSGAAPIGVALLGGLLAMPASYYLSHGLNRKTTIALVASLVGLGLTALLAQVFVNVLALSGWGSEEVGLLAGYRPDMFDVRGLLVAGMVIAILGVLDDITVAQAGVVEQLHAANPSWTWEELYTRAMHVGQDHIASMVNTLVLVYAGGSLPLLLIFTEVAVPIGYVLSSELVAEQIVQMLVTSIGLVATVPLTTVAAALAAGRRVPALRRPAPARKKPLPYD